MYTNEEHKRGTQANKTREEQKGGIQEETREDHK